jgi:hypothetical protein
VASGLLESVASGLLESAPLCEGLIRDFPEACNRMFRLARLRDVLPHVRSRALGGSGVPVVWGLQSLSVIELSARADTHGRVAL